MHREVLTIREISRRVVRKIAEDGHRFSSITPIWLKGC